MSNIIGTHQILNIQQNFSEKYIYLNFPHRFDLKHECISVLLSYYASQVNLLIHVHVSMIQLALVEISESNQD